MIWSVTRIDVSREGVELLQVAGTNRAAIICVNAWACSESSLPQDHPPDGLPEPPPLDEEMDVSQAGAGVDQPVSLHAGPGAPDASLPPTPYSPPHSYTRDYQTLSSDALPPEPVAPQRGTMRADGAYVPEGKPSDWDLH